jgi:hypothetical protein
MARGTGDHLQNFYDALDGLHLPSVTKPARRA